MLGICCDNHCHKFTLSDALFIPPLDLLMLGSIPSLAIVCTTLIYFRVIYVRKLVNN